MKRKKTKRASMTINRLLASMPIHGYMKFNLDSADDHELFVQTVECIGDFKDPVQRANILGTPHYYKFTVTLCNFSGLVLSEHDYFISQPIDHHEFEQVIRQFVNEQAETFGHRKVISGKHSTIQISVYNPNHKDF